MSSADDAITLGELTRNVDTLARDVRDLIAEIRQLSQVYVPRVEHELQIGGVKVDIRRIGEAHAELERRAENAHADLHRRISAEKDRREAAVQAERDARVNSTRWALGFSISALGLLVSMLGAAVAILPRLVP